MIHVIFLYYVTVPLGLKHFILQEAPQTGRNSKNSSRKSLDLTKVTPFTRLLPVELAEPSFREDTPTRAAGWKTAKAAKLLKNCRPAEDPGEDTFHCAELPAPCAVWRAAASQYCELSPMELGLDGESFMVL